METLSLLSVGSVIVSTAAHVLEAEQAFGTAAQGGTAAVVEVGALETAVGSSTAVPPVPSAMPEASPVGSAVVYAVPPAAANVAGIPLVGSAAVAATAAGSTTPVVALPAVGWMGLVALPEVGSMRLVVLTVCWKSVALMMTGSSEAVEWRTCPCPPQRR